MVCRIVNFIHTTSDMFKFRFENLSDFHREANDMHFEKMLDNTKDGGSYVHLQRKAFYQKKIIEGKPKYVLPDWPSFFAIKQITTEKGFKSTFYFDVDIEPDCWFLDSDDDDDVPNMSSAKSDSHAHASFHTDVYASAVTRVQAWWREVIKRKKLNPQCVQIQQTILMDESVACADDVQFVTIVVIIDGVATHMDLHYHEDQINASTKMMLSRMYQLDDPKNKQSLITLRTILYQSATRAIRSFSDGEDSATYVKQLTMTWCCMLLLKKLGAKSLRSFVSVSRDSTPICSAGAIYANGKRFFLTGDHHIHGLLALANKRSLEVYGMMRASKATQKSESDELEKMRCANEIEKMRLAKEKKQTARIESNKLSRQKDFEARLRLETAPLTTPPPFQSSSQVARLREQLKAEDDEYKRQVDKARKQVEDAKAELKTKKLLEKKGKGKK